MNPSRLLAIGCVIAFATSILSARVHPFGNARLYNPAPAAPILEAPDIPPNVRGILTAKCMDCHSTQTRTPFYGRLAPFSWLMERDIVHARTAMNLSDWQHYSPEDRDAFKVKILLETKSRHMPLPQYRFIHWNARITTVDIDALNLWARQSGSPAASDLIPSTAAGDAVRGEDLFRRRCTGCHSLDQDREGPRLRGVFGRTSGSVPQFDYSPAIKQAHIVWNEASLNRWLTDPDAFVSGNNMEFRVPKPQDRSDLIRFLKEIAQK